MADNLTGIISGLMSILIAIVLTIIFAIIAVVWWQVILMIFVIVIYETLISLDLSGSLHTIANAIASTAGKGEALVSLVPNPKPDIKAESFLYKLNSPFRMLIQVNRAVLYFAFFAVLMTSPLISSVFNMPSAVEATIFTFLNNLVTFEVPTLSIFLVLVVISSIIDILEIVAS
ncbi:MAG: hypothetical protein QXH07_01210 [Thermoplasmata archaeon]